MQIKTNIMSLTFISFLLLITGCAQMINENLAKVENMVPHEGILFKQPSGKSLMIEIQYSNRYEFPPILTSNFDKALIRTLEESNMFLRVAQIPSEDYQLKVDIRELALSPSVATLELFSPVSLIGQEFSSRLRINYRIMKISSLDIIFDESISSSFKTRRSGGVSDTYAAVTEQAVKENLRQFLNRMFKVDF